MLVEVHGNQKPGNPRKAIATGALLLLFALSLAGALASVRGGDPLGPVVQPEGWSASFRAPRRFRQVDLGSPNLGLPYAAQGVTMTGAPVSLEIYRFTQMGLSNSAAVCEAVMRMHLGLLGGILRLSAPVRTDRSLGTSEAAQLSTGGAVVRAVLRPSGESYAVFMRVDGDRLGSSELRLFELTCASFEFDDGN